MVFEVIKEYTYVDNVMILTIILLFLICFITIILLEIMSRYKEKIHKSYHKGYNQAKSDKVKYYATIKEIIDSYNNVFNMLRQKSFNVNEAKVLIDFKDKLLEYQQK